MAMILRPVTREEVETCITAPNPNGHPFPTKNKDEWEKDHSGFIINILLPQIKPPLKIYQITVEAYLSGIETQTDGSSIVPDYTYQYGRIKDWQGIMHDYIFTLNAEKRMDVFGHRWGFFEANWAYGVALKASGFWFQAIIRTAALNIGAYIAWVK